MARISRGGRVLRTLSRVSGSLTQSARVPQISAAAITGAGVGKPSTA